MILQAVHAGNLSACVAAARLCEQSNTLERGAKYWGQAARLGHPEAQWRVGLAFYKGILGQQRDPEEAMMWLSRAAKQLTAAVDDAQGSGAANEPPPATSLPPMMTAACCRSTLSQAAHILGILHLDGEGTKQDATAAIYWLKIASCCGCAEAGRMLGSLFRNGQY
jgi:TPR repeat protein